VCQVHVIRDSRKPESEKSQYNTLATPSGLDPEAIKTSRSLSVDFKEPWMRLLFHRKPPVCHQYFGVVSMGGGKEIEKRKEKFERSGFICAFEMFERRRGQSLPRYGTVIERYLRCVAAFAAMKSPANERQSFSRV